VDWADYEKNSVFTSEVQFFPPFKCHTFTNKQFLFNPGCKIEEIAFYAGSLKFLEAVAGKTDRELCRLKTL
jgi:hypothetical protein